MTFSLIVREAYEKDGEELMRFGIGVTTNNPGIGVFCPSVSENGVVGAQYGTHGEVGPQILKYLNDGLQASDVVPAVIKGNKRAHVLQVHALCRETGAIHHGSSMEEYHEEPAGNFGDETGPNCSVAGNSLANSETLGITVESFQQASSEDELAERLLNSLKAGDAAGGDGRDNNARSAAIKVVDPGAGMANEWYNDLRVDASKTPLEDLGEQYELAKSYYEEASKEW